MVNRIQISAAIRLAGILPDTEFFFDDHYSLPGGAWFEHTYTSDLMRALGRFGSTQHSGGDAWLTENQVEVDMQEDYDRAAGMFLRR